MPKRKASEPLADKGQNGISTTHTSKKRRKAEDELINEANAMPINDFKTKHIDNDALLYSKGDAGSSTNMRIALKAAKDLSKHELNACFDLIEFTSRTDYESSSWGWHSRRKKREMKEDEMRYLLVRSVGIDKHSKFGREHDVEGFLSFMLTHDSTPSVPVLYVYEIHLTPQLRKLGLGAHLMQLAESIAKSVGVEKVMLTCLLSNEKAHSYYKRRGYVTDVCSPEDRTTRNKTVKADYVIMWKRS